MRTKGQNKECRGQCEDVMADRRRVNYSPASLYKKHTSPSSQRREGVSCLKETTQRASCPNLGRDCHLRHEMQQSACSTYTRGCKKESGNNPNHDNIPQNGPVQSFTVLTHKQEKGQELTLRWCLCLLENAVTLHVKNTLQRRNGSNTHDPTRAEELPVPVLSRKKTRR